MRKAGMAKAFMAERSNSIMDICKTLNVSKSTQYRSIRLKGESEN
jgi:hypothetical protein